MTRYRKYPEDRDIKLSKDDAPYAVFQDTTSVEDLAEFGEFLLNLETLIKQCPYVFWRDTFREHMNELTKLQDHVFEMMEEGMLIRIRKNTTGIGVVGEQQQFNLGAVGE